MYLASLVLVAACGDALPRTSLIPNQATASAEVRDACRLTEIKCSRCHTLGRIISFDASTRGQWEPIVTRMRQMVSSGITKADSETVLRCLGNDRHAVFEVDPGPDHMASRALLDP